MRRGQADHQAHADHDVPMHRCNLLWRGAVFLQKTITEAKQLQEEVQAKSTECVDTRTACGAGMRCKSITSMSKVPLNENERGKSNSSSLEIPIVVVQHLH